MAVESLALSINQPWAGLIAAGLKDIENRDWPTRYRGPVLIHAGLKIDRDAMDDVLAGLNPLNGLALDRLIPAEALLTGGIVGEATVVDCVSRSDSQWFCGRFGFVLADTRITPFRPCKGALGFFTPDFTSRYAVRAARDEGVRTNG